MTDTSNPTASLRKKIVLGAGTVVAVFALAFFLRSPSPAEVSKSGIPIPFLSGESALKGAVTYFGKRNGIDVYEVTYKNGEKSETLLPDRIYLVHIPNNLIEILDVPLDIAMTSVVTGGRHVNYYGYKYSDAAASDERKNFAAVLFKDRFPAQFFASQKARDEDSQHGNQLAAFELQNGVTFRKTDGSSGSVRMDPTGSLYVFIVNEPGGANLFARPGGICGNGVLEPGEECDDLNTDNTDSCSNVCRYNIPIPFGTGSIAAGTKLALSVQTVAPTGNAVLNQTGVTLMRFDTGGPEDTRLNSVIAKATTGSLMNATQYELWVDADHEGHIDTKVSTGSVSNGLLTFSLIGGLSGYPIPANAVTTFEIRGTIAASPVSSKIQLGLASTRTDYVAGRRETPAIALAGIRLDGLCLPATCQIAVTNRASTVWNITNVSICGNGVITSAETCDDANTTAGDGCSATCATESGYTCIGQPSVCSPTPVCGDGTKAVTEGCDDANTTAGDGCSATCTVESGYTCTGTAPSVCTQDPVCGNGTKEGSEACDDSNTTAGDGCSATCTVETGYACTGTAPSVCSGICGDGLIKGSEACDDANTTAGDGCSATCTIESGYDCSGTPSTCSPVVCGNGTKEGSEGCDDANTTAGDGCSATCTVESGYTCTGTAPSVCTQDPVCGNGTKEGSEACDDSNTTAGDGCSATCTVETGYTCTGTAPSVCSGICGDGLIKGSEACDDANTTAGDGCSATCTVESGYTCTGTPSTCTQGPVCGNGVIEGTEECDDGNQVDTDDCDNTCHLTTPLPNF